MIDKIKARWALLKEAWPYLLHPNHILQMRDVLAMYHEHFHHMDAETWKDEVVQSLKQELDARKAAMDEEEQAHEAAEEELLGEIRELRGEIAVLTKQIAKAKAERAAALAEKAYLLQERADALRTKTTPADR